MILKEAVRLTVREASDYKDSSTNFDVKVRRSSDSKYIQKIVGTFKNEHGSEVTCTIGFINDYTVELGVSVDSERISSSKGMFKTLKTSGEFYKKFLSTVLERVSKHRVDLIFFNQQNRQGDDIHDSQVKQVIAPEINNMLDSEWTEVGHYTTPKKQPVFLWKRQERKGDKTSIASSQGPDNQPSWHKSKMPDTSDPNDRYREPTSADKNEFSQQGDKINQLKSRMFSKESAQLYRRMARKLNEALNKERKQV